MTKRRALLVVFVLIAVAIGFLFFPPSVFEKRILATESVSNGNTPIPLQTPTQAAAKTPDVSDLNKYVAPNGDDTNPGSKVNPWKTIQYAVTQANPGDVIIVQAGTYQEAVHILRAGSAEHPITLKAAENASVVIDGRGNPAIQGEADRWVVSGFQLTSRADRTVRIAGSYWQVQKNQITGAVYFWGNNNLFEENEVDGSQHYGNENGVMDDGPSSHHNVFRNNKIHDFKLRGIWSQWLTHDDLFEGNTIYNITAETGMGIDLDAASNVGYRHTIRGNIIHDCAQTGIELENSYATVVENNIVYRTGLEGIQVINYQGCAVAGESDQYGDPDGDCRGDDLDTIVRQNLVVDGGRVGGIVSYHSSGGKIYNNTVYGSGAGLYILGDATFAKNWDVRGNIFAGNTRVQVSVDDPRSMAFDQHNLIFQPDGENAYEIRGTNGSGSKFFSLAEWQQTFSLGQESVQADPMFVDPGKNDFRLKPGSPAIDAGFNVEIQQDINNNPRLVGKGVDIGAYER